MPRLQGERHVTNAIVTRSAYRRRQGADKCDLFAIISSSALSFVVAFVIVLRRSSLASKTLDTTPFVFRTSNNP